MSSHSVSDNFLSDCILLSCRVHDELLGRLEKLDYRSACYYVIIVALRAELPS